ncbi:MAG: hypothetical protein JWM18_4836 [Chloroflexi bacterium]|jgi:hypothetical protein|nr:hypothetical protein [Chloroflexota bacterium]
MNWLIALFAVSMVAGLRRQGRMGSTYVTILVGTAAILAYEYSKLGAG